MSTMIIRPTNRFNGKPKIPGDKSVSHRGLIFGALAEGVSEIAGLLESGDVMSTARCLRGLGVKIYSENALTKVQGVGMQGFSAPTELLDCGNSGTTMRLLMGVLAGQKFKATLSGDESLVRRPMKRVAEPLRQMGANITLTNDNYAPLTIDGCQLRGVKYDLKIASAQIKSAIILAALSAEGVTEILGEIHSRDHTEKLLNHFGVHIEATSSAVKVRGGQKLRANKLLVPGDPSTAAFWIAAATIIPGAEVELENISLNPTRTGFIKVLGRMGAKITTELTSENPEPIGRIRVVSSRLNGVHITKDEIPSLIDEVPLLAVLATQATGETKVEGAEELRVKESDRLEAVAKNLRAMGVQLEMRKDGFVICGPQKLKGGNIHSELDHRIAMAFSIAGLVAEGPSTILDAECVGISYPAFYDTLKELVGG